MNIQWYPGHMAKASRQIDEALKMVDAVLVVGDARAPVRSVNGDFLRKFSGKRIYYVFNKTDLADESAVSAFRKSHPEAHFVDCMHKTGLSVLKKELASIKATFRFNREVRAMAVGIPNVGKSALLNALADRGSLVTQNRPAVTRALKWLKSGEDFFLLDTPGVLTPKFSDPADGFVLACLGSVRPEVLDMNETALAILEFLASRYPHLFTERFKAPALDPQEMFEAVAKARGFLMKGGVMDEDRTARAIFEEMRNGKFGRISFDAPGVGTRQ